MNSRNVTWSTNNVEIARKNTSNNVIVIIFDIVFGTLQLQWKEEEDVVTHILLNKNWLTLATQLQLTRPGLHPRV